MTKPNFLVIGAAKCGSTSLCNGLAGHPDVFLSDPKEPFFFSHDSIYANGWAWYEALFDTVSSERAVGEGTTTYSQHAVHPKAADRIAHHLGEPRLIYIVRHPLSQLQSHWIWLRTFWHSAEQRGVRITDSFADDVEREPIFVDTCSYWHQLSVYRRFVRDSRILIVFFEDFVADPGRELRRCFEFLDVDPDAPLDSASLAANPSDTLRTDRPFAHALRRWGITPAVRRLTPTRLAPLLRRAVKQPAPGKPSWSPEHHASVLRRIRPDARELLHYAGKPRDFWDLDEQGD